MVKNNQKRYNLSIDILRTVAILAVLLIHTTTRTLEVSSFALDRLSWTLFLNQISRFAVPVFFMISGFVLELNYPFHKSYFSYLYKRIHRLFIPYIFWSAIYYFFVYTNHTKSYFNALVDGDSSYQLYFIPTLLIFYVFFPLIRLLTNKWLLIVLSILQVAILYDNYSLKPLSFYYYPLIIASFGYYVFLLGIVASRNQEKLIKILKNWVIIVVSAAGALAYIIYFEGKSLYLKTHNYLSFYSQWRPSVFFYTIALAGSFFYLFNGSKKFASAIKTLSGLSFFVFFIHVIILEVLWSKFGIYVYKQSQGRIAENAWYDPAFFLIVAVISFSIAYFVHKIPFLSKLTG